MEKSTQQQFEQVDSRLRKLESAIGRQDQRMTQIEKKQNWRGEFLMKPITEVEEFSIRTKNTLRAGGLSTVADILSEMEANALPKFRNMGALQMEEIKTYVATKLRLVSNEPIMLESITGTFVRTQNGKFTFVPNNNQH